MLGYRTYPIGHIFRVNRHSHARKFSALQLLLPITLLTISLFFSGTAPADAQQIPPPAKGGDAELSAKGPQRRQGNLFIADDDVAIHYADQHLRAVHIEYNDQTNDAFALGNVKHNIHNHDR